MGENQRAKCAHQRDYAGDWDEKKEGDGVERSTAVVVMLLTFALQYLSTFSRTKAPRSPARDGERSRKETAGEGK